MQTCLEKRALEERPVELVRNDYSPVDEYNDRHPNALSTGDPKGKGTQSSYVHTIPNCDVNEETKNMIRPQLNTETGGGQYDIEGRNEIGGRNFLMNISVYNQNTQYGAEMINTLANRIDGQIVV